MEFFYKTNLAFIIIILQCICSNNAQIVSVSPAGYNASEGSNQFTFNCTAMGEINMIIRTIIVDGIANDEERDRRGISITMTSFSTSTITIEANLINNNITISCFAFDSNSAVFASEESSLFLVQGLLSPPGALRFVSTPSSMNSKILSWSPPYTIDITDEDPDIIGYRVCFNLTEILDCVMTEDTSYEFLNLYLPLEFSVTALNVVGESNASVLFQQACVQDTAPALIDSGVAQVQISQDESFYIKLFLQQQVSDATCHDVYSIDVTTSTPDDIYSYRIGPFIPVLVEPNMLELTLPQDLEENAVYNITVVAVNRDGETASNGNLSFSTYDVQGVTLSSQTGGGLRLSCSFLMGSLANGCQLTVCQRREGGEVDPQSCMEETLTRDIPTRVLSSLDVGVYVIIEVADVESDGNLSIINDISYLGVLEVNIVDISTITSIGTNSPETAELTPTPASNLGTIVGSIIGVVAVFLLVGIVAVVLFILWWKNSRTGKLEVDQRELTYHEGIDASRPISLASNSVTLSREDGPIVHPSIDNIEFGARRHRPTSPFYTDVMHATDSVPVNMESDNIPPELPPKKSMGSLNYRNSSETTTSVCIPPPVEFEETLKNLSQEDIHEIHLSTSHEKTDSKVDWGNSQELLLSQGSTTQYNLTYAELELSNRPKKSHTLHDKTGVLYSEIRVDEIPPILPQKKHLKTRTGSNASSCALEPGGGVGGWGSTGRGGAGSRV